MNLKVLRCLLAFLPALLTADKAAHRQEYHPDYEFPWLTGPLIAPSGLVVPYPHYNIETYVNIIANTGEYSESWNAVKNPHTFYANSIQPVIQFGLTSWMDIEFIPQLYYNNTDGVGNWAFGDIDLVVDIQLLNGDVHQGWLPDIKLTLREVLPTGKYHRLDPNKKGTDVGGNGSFTTGVGIVLGKLIHLGGIHFMTARLLLEYNLPAATRLRGYNVYGGGKGTNVKFFPAQNAQIDLGLEFTLTRNWAFALDILGSWAKGPNYSGEVGIGIDMQPPQIGQGSPSLQYSLAPAIEYNWSSQLGIIAGSWFTIAGKNAVQFYSGMVAFNYYH